MGGKMKIFSFGVVLTTLFTSFVSLAGTLVINNNQSDPRAKEVMYAFIDAFDKAHPEVTVVVNDFDHEEYKVAIRNFLQAFAPDIAVWFAGNRMKFFVDQGLFDDARFVYQNSLKTIEEFFGQDHPQTSTVYNNLVCLENNLGLKFGNKKTKDHRRYLLYLIEQIYNI